MKHKELLARYLLLVFSLFLIAFGVSLITKSTLGAAPISALAYVLSGGTLEGVREGTVIVAFVTGFIVRGISPYLGWLRRTINSLSVRKHSTIF